MTRPTIAVSGRTVADVACLGEGVFAPLTGFMGREDYEGVLREMRLGAGALWSLPVCLPATDEEVAAAKGADEVELVHEGRTLATLHVSEVYRYDKELEAKQSFGTTEDAHPGVAALNAQPDTYIAGQIEVVSSPHPDADAFAAYRRTPEQVKSVFAERGWKSVVGFQTRNPVHRAHEYLQKCALEQVDGLLLHPLVGETKADDVPARVRMKCYEVLLEGYYPAQHVLLSVFPAAMRYAGPREAVFHALCRRNYGCTHFIVGRDHAGVGRYYGSYDAHELLRSIPAQDLGITPLFYENAFWCWDCESMASTKTCPHSDERRVLLSGTQVRKMLGDGVEPPQEYSRPEVARVLIDYYRSGVGNG